MTTKSGYVVWARGGAEHYDTRDEAFKAAYTIHNSDHVWVNRIEGPDSNEDLDDSHEYREWERLYEVELARKEKQNPPTRPTHRVFICDHSGYWEVVEWVYPPDFKWAGASLEAKRDKWIAVLGVDRVKVQEC